MFQFPESITAEEFLHRHWQKSLLFMPQALPDGLPELSADELGWLATLDDVESRLVFTQKNDSSTSYRVEHGPFQAETLATLPPDNWTLLVQDVEKHLPAFRDLVLAASFVPDWRIDDLMVSFAAPGGSVGPHRDNYDVFLCQGHGRREWRIAAEDIELRVAESGSLSLLEPFEDDSPIAAKAGDVLYLPPGIAHWGIAPDACMTYSIGMRAPTQAEFIAGISRILDTDIDYDKREEIFYGDTDLSAGESEPGLISEQALNRAKSCFARPANVNDDEFAIVFGSVVTDVKAWLAPEMPSEADIVEFLASDVSELQLHGMARLAYTAGAGMKFVFVNGFARPITGPELTLIRSTCSERCTKVTDNALFLWLLAHGAFDLPAGEQNDAT